MKIYLVEKMNKKYMDEMNELVHIDGLATKYEGHWEGIIDNIKILKTKVLTNNILDAIDLMFETGEQEVFIEYNDHLAFSFPYSERYKDKLLNSEIPDNATVFHKKRFLNDEEDVKNYTLNRSTGQKFVWEG